MQRQRYCTWTAQGDFICPSITETHKTKEKMVEFFGGYQDSCENCSISRTGVLQCSCKAGDGTWSGTSLNLQDRISDVCDIDVCQCGQCSISPEGIMQCVCKTGDPNKTYTRNFRIRDLVNNQNGNLSW